MAAAAEEEFVLEYVTALKELTFNSKPMINTLTMLASENKAYASSLVAAIESHILVSALPCKLPATYLLDSIVKNAGEPYVSLFAAKLPETFGSVWQLLPSSRGALLKLANTWHGIFPEQVLLLVQRIASGAQAQPASYLSTLQQNYVQQAQYMSYPAAPMQPSNGQYNLNGMPASDLPGNYGYYPSQAAIPQHSYQPAPQPAAQPYHIPVHLEVPVNQPFLPQPMQPPFQQQYHVQAPAPAPPAAAAAAEQLVLPDLLSSLMQAGLLTVPAPAPATSSGQQPAGTTGTWPPAQPHVEVPSPESLKFDADKLKVNDGSLVRKLLAASDASRGAALDARYLHQRRLAERGRTCRQWFVPADAWLAGTTADTVHAAPRFFEDGEEGGQEAEAPVPSVPVDDAQPACALSGERFRTFWEPRAEEWHYRGAVRLDAETAARYGLEEGALVLASCLAAAPVADLLAPAAGVVAAAQEAQAVADDLAAAALAQADTAGGSVAELKDVEGTAGPADARAPAQSTPGQSPQEAALDADTVGTKRPAETLHAPLTDTGPASVADGETDDMPSVKRVKVEQG